MKRFLPFPILLLVAACSTSSEDPVADEPLEDEVVTGVAGTYRPDAPNSGQFEFLTLRSDKTYHASLMITNPRTQQEGTYRFAGNRHGRYIVLNPGDENYKQSWRYTLRPDGSLQLFWSSNTDSSFLLERSTTNAWCAAPSECALQSLPAPRCPFEWTCEANKCGYSSCGHR